MKYKSNIELQTAGVINTELITFDTTYIPTGAEAQATMYWNDTDETVDLIRDGTTLQIGMELFAKVRNISGATILNGSIVYASGSIGIFPTVDLALADAESTSVTVGIATEDISSPSFGTITTLGYVRGLKTNYSGAGIWGTTWVEGDVLWVSKTVAGQLTNVEPQVTHYSDKVATVGVVHPSQGTVLVGLDRHRLLTGLSDVNGTPLTVTGQMLTWDNTAGYFDFTENINDYLPLTGGTLTGQLTISGSSEALRLFGTGTGAANESNIRFYESNGTVMAGYIGMATAGATDFDIYNAATNQALILAERPFPGDVNGLQFFDGSNAPYTVWHSGNSNFVSVNVGTAWTSTGNNNFSFRTTAADGGLAASADTAALEVYATTGNDAYMQFHIASQYAFNFGIDKNTNDLFVGGWSMGNASYKIWHQGNDGTGSGLDADTLRTFAPTTNTTGNTIALRNSNGYLFATYFNGSSSFSTSGANSGMANIIGTNGTDTYARSYSKIGLIALLNTGSGLDADLYQGYGMSAPGNRFAVMTSVGGDGVLEIGRYIDFHNSNADTSDYTFRIDNSSTGFLNFQGSIEVDGLVSSGALGALRLYAGYDSGVASSVSCSGWFRSSNSTGWYNATYGGGIYQTDTTYVRVYASKQFRVDNNVLATNFTLSSDSRLKKNITPYNVGEIKTNWVWFEWKDKNIQNRKQLGLIAQELEKTNPEFVITDTEGYKSVAYTEVLIAKMAEKDREIEDLTTRIERLELIIKDLL